MAIIKIPAWNKTNFDKKIKSLRKRGYEFSVKDLGERLFEQDGYHFTVNAYEINSNISYIVNGWAFVGTIEHKDDGNVIFKCGEQEIPHEYYNAPCRCDHCNTIRKRNDTYLVKEISTNTFRQVGRQCLKDYTGLNPSWCLESLSIESELKKLSTDDSETIESFGSCWTGFKGYDSFTMTKIALAEIKAHGFTRSEQREKATWRLIEDMYGRYGTPMASDEEVKAFQDWSENLDTVFSDFLINAKRIANSEYMTYRDLPFFAPYVNTYFRVMARKAEEAKEAELRNGARKVYNVGDKIIIDVASIRVLYTKSAFCYGATPAAVYEIKDTDHQVYIWSSAVDLSRVYEAVDSHKPAKIMATVKGKKEYRGVEQTVIKNGKVIEPVEEVKPTSVDDIF